MLLEKLHERPWIRSGVVGTAVGVSRMFLGLLCLYVAILLQNLIQSVFFFGGAATAFLHVLVILAGFGSAAALFLWGIVTVIRSVVALVRKQERLHRTKFTAVLLVVAGCILYGAGLVVALPGYLGIFGMVAVTGGIVLNHI